MPRKHCPCFLEFSGAQGQGAITVPNAEHDGQREGLRSKLIALPSIIWLNIMDLQDILNTPQRHQQRTRQALRELAQNVEESPRRRSAARPETPTPLAGHVERTRASSRSHSRMSRTTDLQNSPRRRRPTTTQDENAVPITLTSGSRATGPGTPTPSSFVNYTPSQQPQLSRTVAQQARRRHERQIGIEQEQGPLPSPPLTAPTSNARCLAQQRRRERERQQRGLPTHRAQLRTPPATQANQRVINAGPMQEQIATPLPTQANRRLRAINEGPLQEHIQQEGTQAEPIDHVDDPWMMDIYEAANEES
ncbi:hypothetical protein BDZ97DRAFT_2004621 [Flammula alnicola]|nr:hypothetical protein BDZ97DRAFT_2004621 [Flammula alnicola]